MFNLASNISENGKKTLIILFLIFIIFFVLIGYISMVVEDIMKKQGSKADEMMSNVVKVSYFREEKKFIKFGIRKNIRVFFLESRVPFFILSISWICYLLFCLFSGKWGYNPLNRTDGFASILFEYSSWPKERFFGLKLISGFPKVVTKPHFEPIAIFSYLFVPANIVGIGWFLYCTQGYIARSFRVRKIAKSIYRKKLVPEEPTPIIPEENNL